MNTRRLAAAFAASFVAASIRALRRAGAGLLGRCRAQQATAPRVVQRGPVPLRIRLDRRRRRHQRRHLSGSHRIAPNC